MTDIASVLKSEITRLARKELRVQLEPYKKSASHSKAQIAALREEVGALKAQLRAMSKQRQRYSESIAPQSSKVSRQRFTAKGFSTMRRRLGLSCDEMGLLLGASGRSVRKWEEGINTPREKFQTAIFGLRGLGKGAVAALLSEQRVS